MKNDESVIKLGIQTVEFYRDFVAKANQTTDQEAYLFLLASLLSEYSRILPLDQIVGGLQIQLDHLTGRVEVV